MTHDVRDALEKAWFDKLDRPTSGVYRLVHARDPSVQDDGAESSFDPRVIAQRIAATADGHLAALVAAVRLAPEED